MRGSQRVPVVVRGASTAWFVAIGAGVFETVLIVASGRAGGDAILGVAVRTFVFGAATLLVLRMAAGRGWARWVLAATLGALGTLSLTVDPVLWLLHGHSVTGLLRESGPVDLLFGASRVVHVAAVLTACVLMFVPTANRYFRLRRKAAAFVRGSARTG